MDTTILIQANATTLIPVMGTVAPGLPIETILTRQTISIPKNMVGRFQTFALRVDGQSMVDENTQHGDYIVIEARETAENGETVVAMINNEEVTLKMFYVEPDRIRLQPANPNMKPIILRNHEIKILGVAHCYAGIVIIESMQRCHWRCPSSLPTGSPSPYKQNRHLRHAP